MSTLRNFSFVFFRSLSEFVNYLDIATVLEENESREHRREFIIFFATADSDSLHRIETTKQLTEIMTQQDDSREILEAISQLKTDYEEKINDLNEIVEKFNINMNHTRALRDKLNSITKEKNELDMILIYLNSQRHDLNKINVEDISRSESISDSAMYDSSRYASAESLDSIDTFLSAKSSKISDSLVFENNKTNS
jgi:uncharacterized protein YeeX (DUF496 family)